MTAHVRIASPDDLPSVRQLCRDYRDLLAERCGERSEILEHYYSSDAYEALLMRLPVLHAAPDGEIFVAVLDGTVSGCAMTHRINADTCEIKRVFVSPEGRGHGLAKALFDSAMDHARKAGYRRMVLDTMCNLHEAIGLYDRLGFTPTAPFYEPDQRFTDMILFFGSDL